MLDQIRYQLYRIKYNYAQYLNLKNPVDVSLELSSYCTNACGYCYHGDQKNLPFKKGFMDHGMAIDILNQAHAIGVNSLKFNYRGESTMHPQFNAIASYAKNMASGSTFIDRVTNSNFNFRIDNDSIFKGLCAQTKVKVSFDSFRKDIFERQRKGSNYEKTLANMDRYYNYPGRDNIFVVQSVRTSLNKDEDLKHEIKSRWPEAIASIRDVVEGRTQKDMSQTILEKRDQKNRQTCIQAHARLMINWDGNVQMCCPDIGSKLVIGNVKEMYIQDIWNSDKAKKIRESLLQGDAFEKDPCRNCSSFESYRNFKKVWDS